MLRNLITLTLYKGTFPHEAQARVGGAIYAKTGSAGTGLIAGGVVRSLLEVGGVKNALSKSLGSSNKINTSYATLKALQTMESADKWITRKDVKPKQDSKKKPAPETAKESK